MFAIQGRLYRQHTMGNWSTRWWQLRWPWSHLCCIVHRGSPLWHKGNLELEVILAEGWGLLILAFFLSFFFFLRIGVWFEITGQDSLICTSWGRCKKLLERRCIKWSHFPGASAEVTLWFHNLWVQQHYTTPQRTLLYNTTLDRSTSIL